MRRPSGSASRARSDPRQCAHSNIPQYAPAQLTGAAYAVLVELWWHMEPVSVMPGEAALDTMCPKHAPGIRL